MSHQWASRHRGHNLHILTGRTCLRTFSNCLAHCTDFISYQTALFSWLQRFSSADWKGQESLFASYFRNPVCSCSTAVRWGGGGESFKHSTAGLSGPTQPWACGRPTQCALLHEVYSKTPGGYWAPGSIFTWFYQTFWCEMAANEAEHQLRDCNFSAQTPGPVFGSQQSPVYRAWACLCPCASCVALRSVLPLTWGVPPTANRTGLLWR